MASLARVSATVDLIRVKAYHRLQGLRSRDEPELRPIPGDPEEIQQVCLNLIMNAIQAMPKGGRLIINLEYVIRRKEGLDLAPPSPYLMLEFADTGPGVAREDRARIFDAFFTTKDSGEGSGLGLAVSNGIVKDHDGWMEVGDRPEGGALFRVFLPLPTEKSSSHHAKPGATPPPQIVP